MSTHPPPDDAPPPAISTPPKKKRIRPPRTGQPSGAANRRKALGCPLATPGGRDATPEEVTARAMWIADIRATGSWKQAEAEKLATRWGVKVRTVLEYAARGAALLRMSKGGRKQRVAGYLARLEEIAELAITAGKYGDAVRAYESLLKYEAAPAAPVAGRGLSTEGLPPELAKLKNPVATTAECEHFAEVREEACALQGCRVHTRSEAGPVPPAGGEASSSAGPMH